MLCTFTRVGYQCLEEMLRISGYVPCECTYNVRKEKYFCIMFAVQITLYVSTRLNGFYELIVFTIIVFMNTQEKILERKTVSKSVP